MDGGSKQLTADEVSSFQAASAAEAELKRRLDQLHLLLDIGKSIGSQLELRELIGVIADCLREVIHCDAFWMSLVDSESGELRVFALDSKFNKNAQADEGRIFPLEGTMAERVINSLQPLLVTRADLESSNSTVVQSIAAQGIKSSCLAPLIARGRPIGVISMASLRESAFTQADAELLMLIAGQIAIAVENALNFDRVRAAETELKRRLEHLRLMLRITNEIASELDLQELLQKICSSIREAMGNDIVDVSLFDQETGTLRAFVTNFPPEHPLSEKGFPIPLEGGPSGLAFTTGQPVFIDKPDSDRFNSELSARVFNEGYSSGGTIPLIAQGRKLGVLGIINKQENAFSEDEKELLVQVANQVAIAVDNALNFERARKAEQQARRESERSQLLLEINNAVASNLDLTDLMEAILTCLRRVFPYDVVGLAIYDAEINQLRSYANVQPNIPVFLEEGEPIPLERTIPGLVFTSGKPVLLDRFEDARFASKFSKKFFDAGFRSGGSVPLMVHDRTLGALGVGAKEETHLSQDEVDLLCQVANQIAIAVENSLNYERARKAEREVQRKLERERLMLEINNAVVSILDLGELVKAVSASLLDIVPHDAAGIALYEPDLNQLREYSNVTYTDVVVFREGDTIPLEGTPAGEVFVTGKPLLIRQPDPVKYPADRYSQGAVEGSPKSACLVPLISHSRKLGIVGVSSAQVDSFTEDDLDLFARIAGQIAIAVENALAFREIEALKNKLTSEKLYLEAEIRTEHNFEELIGSSPSFKRILKQVETVAPTDSAVLIRGETGTGKELIARAIHNLSARHERTLVKLNCAAIPTGLLESELFGHEKGAFTGAISQRIGRFELANKASLFLDEVGDIPLELQPKLLRVLQEQEFERLGSTRTQKVDVRLIAATNSDLEQMVAEKKYRSDLYYRLNVFPITIPPLRERRDDIPPLARFFTQKYAQRLKKRIESISSEAMTALMEYQWPGNVRELEHFIERAVVLTQGPDLEVSLSELKTVAAAAHENLPTLEAAEREHILRALEEANWVVGGANGAAARLGMKRTTLQSRMQKLGIERGK
jgi:formate hydrogenlyase transcriptional activator